MATLGISYGFHDASAAIVHGGRILSTAAEERFSRQKHDASFPQLAVRHCLEAAGMTAADLDHVVYHESPTQTFTRVIASTLAAFPRSRREFGVSMKAWFGKKLWVENEISRRLGVDPRRIRFASHHQSHAAQAFLGSGEDHAAILTIDAVGEWATTALAVGRRAPKAGAPIIETLRTVEFPHSLGLVYSAFTAWLGFLPMDAECSTMALAAFGEPRFAAKIREILRTDGDGGFTVDQRYFHFDRFFEPPYTRRFLDEFGPARSPAAGAPLPFDCLLPRLRHSAGVDANFDVDVGLVRDHDHPQVAPALVDAQHYADVAASIQLIFEEVVLNLARALHRLTGAKTLCFAGGAALNCVANARLLEEGPFAAVFVPPDPGDGGAAVGAALLVDAEKHGLTSMDGHVFQPFLGPSRPFDLDLGMLSHIDPIQFRRHVKPGVTIRPGDRWDLTTYADDATLAEAVASDLEQGGIVGWVQGPAESGPRALGARSLLVRPDRPDLALRLSSQVKDRARYRPYALSMTRVTAAEILDTDHLHSSLYRWMQAAARVHPEARAAVASGLHTDGTTRPQIVDEATQPLFHALLSAFGRRSGTAALINTSFNESGFPLVSTPLEALALFARTDIDTLVIERHVIRKSRDA